LRSIKYDERKEDRDTDEKKIHVCFSTDTVAY
jgi:hypothetical protein